MKTTTIAPFGGPVDVCWHNGRIVMAWQSGAGTDVRLVVAEIDPVSHVILLSYSIALGDDVGAFPRLLSALGSVWCLYREGQSKGGQMVLARDGREVWRSGSEAGGNHPGCFGWVNGKPWFAWQRFGDNRIFGGHVAGPPGGDGDFGVGAADGLSHIDGARVVLWKDAFGSVAGMTAPSQDGNLVAGEHPDSGVLVRDVVSGHVVRIWPGEETVAPRLSAAAPTGTHAVVTSGVRAGVDYGVRLATFTDADLTTAAPPPGETWDAAGTVVDCARFFDVLGSTVPREAADGQCWQAHESGHDIYIVKGADPRFVEILRLTDDDVRLAYDATDSRYPRAWRLDVIGDGRSDAQWCPTIGVVGGWRAEYPDATIVRRTEGGPSTREPFPYAVAVEAHGRHIDYGGDVGVVDAVLVTTFTPHAGKTNDGYTEHHHWAVKSGRAIGLVRYEEIRHGKVARSFTFNRYVPSRSVPLSSLIVHAIPDPPDASTPAPEPDPMAAPKVEITQYAAQLEPGRDVTVVTVANRRATDVVTVELRGGSLHVGWTNRAGADWSAKRRPVTIGSPATPDPQPPPATPDPPPVVDPPPGGQRLAPLRIEGTAFTRGGRPVLPWYVHGGDLISRASRDWDGAMRLLDEAATLGADGVRMWTYLLGLPFWQGRTFRPNWALVARVVEACTSRGLQVLLSGGDLWQLGESGARAALQETADFIRTHDPDAFDWVDGGNETWHNGQEDPDRLAQACRVLANIGPLVLLTDAPEGGPYPDGDEGKRLYREHMARWCQAPASMLALHSQFSDPDGCIRRTWNGGYETGQWLRAEDETRGPGRNVTVCNAFTPSQMLCLMAASWISGGAPVALCSAGVISDGMRSGHFDAGEGFLEAPGFRDIDRLRRWLPADVMRWKRVHGGRRDGSPRVFAVPNDIDETRADHAINEATGEYVCVISGESRHGVSRVRAASEEDFPGLDDGYRIVKGVAR